MGGERGEEERGGITPWCLLRFFRFEDLKEFENNDGIFFLSVAGIFSDLFRFFRIMMRFFFFFFFTSAGGKVGGVFLLLKMYAHGLWKWKLSMGVEMETGNGNRDEVFD